MRSIRSLIFPLALTLPALCPLGVHAQGSGLQLRGQVLVGDTALTEGTVVLHQVTSEEQGDLDSMAVARDGSFSFRLPAPPASAADRFYFASIRHQGILYFGSALAELAQLDSIYRIQAYDTAMVAPNGREIRIQARNIFFEPIGEEWRVTDIFQLRNEEGRTLVASDGGRVWSYPLPEGARDFSSGQDGFSLDGTSFEDGAVSVRAAIAPGERVFVFRYTVDDPYGAVPTPGNTEALDLLVREPSPRVGVEGLEPVGRVEVETGSTYRRFSAENVGPGRVRIVEVDVPRDLPVEWITILIALVLAAAALLVTRGVRAPVTAGGAPTGAERGAHRQALLVEVARLDEEFAAEASPSAQERAAYEARRAELLRRLRTSA